jgi:hypothetical protein
MFLPPFYSKFLSFFFRLFCLCCSI